MEMIFKLVTVIKSLRSSIIYNVRPGLAEHNGIIRRVRLMVFNDKMNKERRVFEKQLGRISKSSVYPPVTCSYTTEEKKKKKNPFSFHQIKPLFPSKFLIRVLQKYNHGYNYLDRQKVELT